LGRTSVPAFTGRPSPGRFGDEPTTPVDGSEADGLALPDGGELGALDGDATDPPAELQAATTKASARAPSGHRASRV